MAREGYDDATIEDAVSDPQFYTQVATEREIAVATADVGCKGAVNCGGVLAAVEAAYQQRKVDANFEALEVIRTLIQRQLRNAANLLGDF